MPSGIASPSVMVSSIVAGRPLGAIGMSSNSWSLPNYAREFFSLPMAQWGQVILEWLRCYIGSGQDSTGLVVAKRWSSTFIGVTCALQKRDRLGTRMLHCSSTRWGPQWSVLG